MKNIIFTLLLAVTGSLPYFAKADFSGSTYIMNNPCSLCVTNASITINNVVPSPYAIATLLVSNSAVGAITVNWAAPGRALGAGTTNQLLVPGGQVAELDVNATFPGMVVYRTQQEQIVPATSPATNSIPIPELLYYKMTEGSAAYQIGSGYYENSPVLLADSSLHGGSTGTITASQVPIQWVPDENGMPVGGVHFNGASTSLDVGNPTLFNFTTNLFTINVWMRNLTYPCAICGNGSYLTSGWYVVANPIGEVVVAAENPGVDTYVCTTSPIATVGQWDMITVVRVDTSTVLIYRNALLQSTSGTFADPAPCNNDVLMGNNYYSNHYDGDLGTVRIYNRALSASEINAIYVNDTTP